jgi:hypothetical protein
MPEPVTIEPFSARERPLQSRRTGVALLEGLALDEVANARKRVTRSSGSEFVMRTPSASQSLPH